MICAPRRAARCRSTRPSHRPRTSRRRDRQRAAHAEPDETHLWTSVPAELRDDRRDALDGPCAVEPRHQPLGMVGFGLGRGRAFVQVRCEGGEPRGREAVAHVLDVRDEAPPLVEHDHARPTVTRLVGRDAGGLDDLPHRPLSSGRTRASDRDTPDLLRSGCHHDLRCLTPAGSSKASPRRCTSSVSTPRRPCTTSAPTRPTASDGDTMAAGRAARAAAWITGNVLGDWAVQNGWLARARTILEEAGEDGPERGWVLIIRSFSEPDPQDAGSDAARGDGRRPSLRRSRHRVRRARISRRPVRHDRSGRRGPGPAGRGDGGGLRGRDDRGDHGRRALLRVLLGVRAGQRRPSCRSVDAGGRRPHEPAERRRRVLPCPLRRDPDRRRPLGGGGDGAPRSQQSIRAGHVDEARGRAHPPR